MKTKIEDRIIRAMYWSLWGFAAMLFIMFLNY